MNKSTNFSRKPIISQILDFIPKDLVYRTAKKHNSDRYCKKFTTHDHLITMLYGVLSDCTSLRELSTALLGCGGKISHLGINYFPKRSTLSDANSRRNEKVFEQIYFELYKRYARFLSNSSIPKFFFLVDSTTVTLFSSVLKGVGRNAISGKKKGGLKIHTVINASEDVPCLVKLSQAVPHDSNYIKHIRFLFKRLKQNFPLKYFLGDSANAIKIQVWIFLIAQLILKLIQLKTNRKWSLSTMASLVKFHLLSYIKLFESLKNPHKNFFEITTLNNQTKLLFIG